MLENKLDKAIIKFNEATTIRNTYGVILEKLKQERTAYDKQLGSLKEQVGHKQTEFD